MTELAQLDSLGGHPAHRGQYDRQNAVHGARGLAGVSITCQTPPSRPLAKRSGAGFLGLGMVAFWGSWRWQLGSEEAQQGSCGQAAVFSEPALVCRVSLILDSEGRRGAVSARAWCSARSHPPPPPPSSASQVRYCPPASVVLACGCCRSLI